MPKIEEILKRREKVRRMTIEGFSGIAIANAIKVSLRTVTNDRKAIRKELKEKLKADQREEFLLDFMLKYDDIYRKASHTYNSTDNPNAKVGALRVMLAHFKEKMDILRSMGLIETEPERLELSGTVLTVAEAQKLLDERDKRKSQEAERKE